MQRSSIIATVVAAGGILIAGSVASVAVINAASSSQPDSETIQLVAAGSGATPSATASPSSEARPASPAAALPSIEAAALPVLPEVTDGSTQQAAADTQAAPVTTAPKPAKSKSPKPARSNSASASEDSNSLSADQARSIVLKQGDGVSVVSTSKESHQGYSTWAVRFARSNGEVLTGYVDRKSGVVVDWTVNQQAPAAQPQPSASSDDDSKSDDSSGESEDHSGSGSDDSGESDDD